MRIGRASILCCLFLLGATFTVATTPVQFFDEGGNLITNEQITVNVPGTKLTTVLPGQTDGTYDVPVNIGEPVNFVVGTEVIGSRAVRTKLAPVGGGPVPVFVPLGGPANDDCPNGQAIVVPSVTSGTTVGAATDGVAACGGNTQTSAGVWYTLTGGGTTITLSTCTSDGGSSSFDTKLLLYCQDCGGLTCVGSNDDGGTGCPGFTSRLNFCGQPGGTYRLLVTGYGAGTGNFSLAAIDTGVACTATVNCLPPEPTGSCCTYSTPPFDQGEVPVQCFVGTASECAAAAGTYGGDGTDCIGATIGAFDYVVNPALPIPDNDPAGGNVTINVPDTFFVEDVNVDVGITHTWISDLIIEVIAPSGASQVIWAQVCGSTDNLNATADDSGTETYCAPLAAGPIDSVFWPPALAGEGPLAVLNGQPAAGTWTLNVSDNYALDTGTINQFSLHFIGAGPACAPFECADDPGGGGDDCLECAPGTNGKVTICHFPPGNPAQRHTIEVSANALNAHCMNHGDTCGPCDEGEAQQADEMTTAAGSTSSTFGQNHSNQHAQRSPRAQVGR